MNKFLTFQGQQPLYLGDIDFASAAVRDAFKKLMIGLAGCDPANAIISGVVGFTGQYPVHFSSGVVCIDGEILPVAESHFQGSLSEAFYFRINSSYSGSREFVGGETHDCWETRTVEVTKDVTDYPMSSFRRLTGGIGSQVWKYNDGTSEFRLVKTGAVWNAILKRFAMSRMEDHLFDVDVPGIQPDNLSIFPISEETVITSAYITSNGNTTIEPLLVKYYLSGGNLHIQMDLASGERATGTTYAQVILPVF